MTNYLHEHFLTSREQYEACRKYWKQMLLDISRSRIDMLQFEEWIDRANPDGSTTEEDGNPIFDGRTADPPNRGLRIIQHPPLGGLQEELVSAWINDRTDEPPSDLPRVELVISLVLSEFTAGVARHLLAMWSEQATTASMVRAEILGSAAIRD